MAISLARIWRERPPLGRRAALLLAPSFVIGAAAYMTLAEEPDRWMAVAGLLAATVGAAIAWRYDPARWPSLWLLAGALGFVWAMVSAGMLETPRLEREGAGMLAGTAVWIEAGEGRPRLELRDVAFERFGREIRLDRVRVRLAGGVRPHVGDRVRVRAVMRPPPPAVAPGGFDFQRDAYFKGVGAVGFAIAPLEIGSATGAGARIWFGQARQGFRDAVYRALPDRPDIAGVIAALTVGDRSGVTESDNAALRASGLAHLLAISGLHLGMVAGAVYLVLRLALALPHGFALRYPAHKFAAVGAILAAIVYLGLSGGAPPAQRAFVTVVAAMTAILADRLRSGLWFVAWAAVVVTAASPDVVVGPSFQLSFAAATAIVAAYEVLAARRRREDEPVFARLGSARPVASYVAGILGASLLATLATAPLALAHFQQAPAFGVVANLAAMPAMAFVIMPMAILAGCLSLIGLAAPALQVMALGIEFVLAAAHTVAGWQGGVVRASASPDWVVFAFLAGGVLVCALRGWPRVLALAGPAVAIYGLATAMPPDVLVAGGADLAAFVRDDALYVTSMRRGRFEQEVWVRQVAAAAVRPVKAAAPEWARCDDRGCAATIKGRRVAVSYAPSGLAADCRAADLVVALHAASVTEAMGCAEDATIIDGRALLRNGAHAIWLEPGGIRIETVRGAQGRRLWSGWRPERPSPPQ